MTAFGIYQIQIILFILCNYIQLAKATSFLILSNGSGHDTPETFTFEPRSSNIGFGAIL